MTRLRGVLRGPEQGWSTLVLLGVMAWITGVTVDQAGWAGTGPGGGSETAFLPGLMLMGAFLGFVVGWPKLPIGVG